MSDTKWTPGPWRAVKGNVGDTHPLFVVAGEYGTGFRPWTDADAHLIAAAPDLYSEHYRDDQLLMKMATVILNDKVADYIPLGLRAEVEDRLRAGTPALAKARGESK